jgi:chemotaxis protein methyltransferase CheR
LNAVFDRTASERFRTLLSSRLGLDYADDKLEYLANVAQKLAASARCSSADQYLERLAACDENSPAFAELAEELTVTETYFCRSSEHFRVLTEVVVAEARARGSRRLRLLSAGCASGEEPYSMAIHLREAVPDLYSWDVTIVGVDVNPAMLEKAKRATYSAWSLRATPEPLKSRYFSLHGRDYQLSPEIRRMVTFERRNLADAGKPSWALRALDAVFCRNVMMYFSPVLMSQVVQGLGQSLSPGGFLFLGHAETLRGLSHDYHLCHTHETFYYRRRLASELGSSPRRVTSGAPDTEALSSAAAEAGTWVEAIQNASARIDALAARGNSLERGRPVASKRAVPEAKPSARSWDLGVVIELVRLERFDDALRLLRELPADAQDDTDTMLVLAVLLTNSGARAEAEDACRRLLAADELHAGAHYLMALCREHAADGVQAIEHDQTAIYLDPSFAMPHLHLGLLSHRAGDSDRARRELGQAQVLLAREDASRVALFGGGFSREALIRLCQAELSRLEGAA